MNLRAWWTRRRRLDLDEEDFQEEIRAHLAMAEAEHRAGGADADEARFAALREFGNLARTTERARAVWTPAWVEELRDLAGDARYAVRTLASRPTFTLTATLVLAVGIGLNATVFGMLKGIALEPLGPAVSASGLTVLAAETSTGRSVRLSYPDYQRLRAEVPALANFFGTSFAQVTLGRGRSARPVTAELVTGNYFQGLGVPAGLGRTLLPVDEVAPGRHPVVVISDSLWRRDFAGDPSVVGRTLEVERVPLTIVGVAAPAFHGTTVSFDVELFVPVMMAPQLGLTGGLPPSRAATMLSDRRAAVLYPHGVLPAGVSLAAARAQLETAWEALERDRAPGDLERRLRLLPFLRSPTGGQAIVLPFVLVLSAMGLLVLFVASANIAGLVLVRGLSRRGEIAVRLALGAARGRVVRLLVLENLVLAIPGAMLGLLLSARAMPALLAYAEWLSAPQRLYLNIGVDWLVVAFVAVVAVCCALGVGLAPSWQASNIDLVTAINEDASPRGAARGRGRALLVVAQVAISLVLLVGAGLTARSVEATRDMDPGFTVDGVATVQVDVTHNGYDAVSGRRFYRDWLERARGAPGVTGVSIAEFQPLAFLPTRARPVTIDGYVAAQGVDGSMLSNVVGPGYFDTLDIAVVAGRALDDRDDPSGAPVAMVNQAFADRFWGGPAQALGRRLQVGDGDWRTVVGVAADIKYIRVDEGPTPYVYLPLLQEHRSSVILHLRGQGPAEGLVEQARGLVEAIDPELPILAARPMQELTRGATLFLDLAALMLAIFGAAGLVLAALGTYGLVAYTAQQSTHEIGVRMALGASRGAVVRAVVGRGLRLALVGAALGAVGALAAGSALRTVLFGVSPADPIAFASATAAVLAGVCAATAVPAWRASRTEPLEALRHH